MLYEPVRVGRLCLKNRLVMPPMQTDRAMNGHVTESLLEHYRLRAKGAGPGLIITEHSCIRADGRADAGQLSLIDAEHVAEHRQLTGLIHACGSACFAQLNHAGAAAELPDGQTTISASAIANPRKKLPPPRPMTVEEILALERDFARAALRAQEAGYDGVELHCAHGYLLNQFYSPLTNRREDAYGAGSVEDRGRFLLETVQAVREAVGEDYPLAVRLGGADYLPGGATEEDAVALCRLLEQASVDLLDISGGMCGFIRPGHTEPGYFGSMTEKIRAAVSVPVLLTGGIRRAEEAEALLSQSKADLIGVGRVLLQNPNWPGEDQ